MKILLLTNMYPSKEKPYGGIFVQNQYRAIKKQLGSEDRIQIFYMRRKITRGVGTLWKYLRAGLRFIPHLFHTYEIVHLHFFYPLIYLVYAYKKLHPGVKVVVTFHGSDINYAVNERNSQHLSKIAKCVDFAIPVGSTIAGKVNQKLNLEPGMILPVGVDREVFYPQESTPKTYDFIWVGSFKEVKGIDLMIACIQKLDRKDLKYCFCGSGPYLPQLLELQKQYDIEIRQNVSQKDLGTLLNQSHFFVLLSRNEGFPTATIEAMYCGVPVLTSDIPQFKEQVTEGINGYTVPLENIDATVAKMSELAEIDSEKYRSLQQGALQSLEAFSLEKVCANLIDVYRNVTR